MIELRDFKEEDIAQLTHILNDAEVSKYLSTKIPQPYTQQDSHWWINAGSKTGIIQAFFSVYYNMRVQLCTLSCK